MPCADGELHDNEVEKIPVIGKNTWENFNKKQFVISFKYRFNLLTEADEMLFTERETRTLETFSKMKHSSENETHALSAFFCQLAVADSVFHKEEAPFIDK